MSKDDDEFAAHAIQDLLDGGENEEALRVALNTGKVYLSYTHPMWLFVDKTTNNTMLINEELGALLEAFADTL